MNDFPPSRLEFGVQLRPHHTVHTVTGLDVAQARVDEAQLATALVMVREHDVGEWMPWDFYERYGASHDGDDDGRALKRRQLYDMSQFWQLRNEIWRLRLQLNTEWDSIPTSRVKDLPTEWRSMLSLKVEDVARELETIIAQEQEKKKVPRSLPEAKVDETHPVKKEVRIKVGRRRHTYRSMEDAVAHLAMAKAAVAEFERRELEQ